MRLQMTNAAEAYLADLLVTKGRARISSFKVSANSGFVPNAGAGDVSGPVVYSGEPSQIKFIEISDNEISFIIELEHGLGNFGVGNFMAFLAPPSSGQAPIPFLFGALPVTAQKYASDLPQYQVGNKVYMHATVWFPYLTDCMDMAGHQKMYAHLVNYRDETVLPGPDIGEYEQYVLDRHTLYDGATFVMKDTLRSLWWGQQFTQFIEDPNRSEIRGGIIPDPHGSPSTTEYFDGRRYNVSNSSFTKIDGGDGWSPANEEPLDGGGYPTVSILIQNPNV